MYLLETYQRCLAWIYCVEIVAEGEPFSFSFLHDFVLTNWQDIDHEMRVTTDEVMCEGFVDEGVFLATATVETCAAAPSISRRTH